MYNCKKHSVLFGASVKQSLPLTRARLSKRLLMRFRFKKAQQSPLKN